MIPITTSSSMRVKARRADMMSPPRTTKDLQYRRASRRRTQWAEMSVMTRLMISLILVSVSLGCRKDKQESLRGKDIGELINDLRNGKPEEKPAVALELSKRG